MTKFLPLAVLAAAAMLTACGGGGDNAPLPTVATQDATIPITLDTAPAVLGQELVFESGVPEFGTTDRTTVNLKTTSSFSVSSSAGSADGDLSYGSCIFLVRNTSYPNGHPLKNTTTPIEVDPCTIDVRTKGVVTSDTEEKPLVLSVHMGHASSVTTTQPVRVTTDGTVYINGKNVGKIKTSTGTGAGTAG